MHRENSASVLQRGQDKVGRVVQVDRSAEPVRRQRHLGAMPHDGQPAFADADLAPGKVARGWKLRRAAAVRARIDQPVVVDLVEFGQREHLVAHEAPDSCSLVDRGRIVDRDAHPSVTSVG